MNNRNNQIFFTALTLAIVIRLILMIQTSHVGSEAKIAIFDELFLAGNFIPIKILVGVYLFMQYFFHHTV